MSSEQGTTGMFTEADLRQMAASGRAVAEVADQVERLRKGMAWTPLARAATVGDGIRRIAEDDVPRLLKLHESAARSGRLSAFVPASGAGTRLFQSLLQTRNEGLSSKDRAITPNAASSLPAARTAAAAASCSLALSTPRR